MMQATDTADIATNAHDTNSESFSPPSTPRPPNFAVSRQFLTTLANGDVTFRRPRSEVWLHFTKATDYKVSKKATCMHCNKTLVASSGSTSTMHLHLKNHHLNMLATPAGAESLDR
jgi:hypothetical protein